MYQNFRQQTQEKKNVSEKIFKNLSALIIHGTFLGLAKATEIILVGQVKKCLQL